jgi:hypothetical protein
MLEFLEREEYLSSVLVYVPNEKETVERKDSYLVYKSERKEMGEEYFAKAKLDIFWSELPDGSNYGPFSAFHLDGTKAAEGTFVDGKIHGKYLIWYSSGKIMEEIEFFEGRYHGRHISWWESGQILSKATASNGKMVEFESQDRNLNIVHRFSSKFWITRIVERYEASIIQNTERKIETIRKEGKIILPLFEEFGGFGMDWHGLSRTWIGPHGNPTEELRQETNSYGQCILGFRIQ